MVQPATGQRVGARRVTDMHASDTMRWMNDARDGEAGTVRDLSTRVEDPREQPWFTTRAMAIANVVTLFLIGRKGPQLS